MKRSNRSSVALVERATAWMSAMCLGLICSAQAAPALDVPIDFDRLEVAIADINGKLEGLRAEIDQTRFDPDAWLDALEYEAEQVIDAVKTQIAFEPYVGVLRGVTGTLRSRAGNSADQALLLAYLMKSAGFDARIVRGELSDSDVGRLLASIELVRRDESLDYMEEAIEKQFGPGANVTTPAVDWKSSQLSQRSQKMAILLIETLADADLDIAARDVTGELADATRSYFWVQHRDGPGDSWQDAHPVFGETSAPQVTAQEYFADQVPDRHLHRLTVSAWLTQQHVDEVLTHRLMADVTRPIANLDGVAIGYRNHPSGLNPQTLSDIEQAMASTQLLMPTFNGAPAPGAMAFDLKGRVVDPMVAQSPGASLFATLADKLEGATKTVGERDQLLALDSMWLQFTFIEPDGRERTTRRYLVAPASASIPPQEKLWPLITDHSYVVNAGRQPLDYLAERYLAAGIASGEYFKALAHKFVHPGDGTPLPGGDLPADFGALTQYRFMDHRPDASLDVRSMRTQPSLLGIRRGYRDAKTAFVGVDVVANATRHLQAGKNRVMHDVAEAIRQGVWDTTVESLPARSMKLEAYRRANAFEVVNAALAQGIALRVVGPGQSDVADLGLAPSAAAIVREELDRGYVIVIPARPPQGLARSGWWRVRPDTGETLGMTEDGYGAETVEYMIQVTETALALVQAVGSLKACEAEQAMDTKLCCLVEAHVNNVGGLAFGGTLGALVGTSGAALFTIVDYGTSLATEAALGQGQGLMPKAALGCDRLPATDW